MSFNFADNANWQSIFNVTTTNPSPLVVVNQSLSFAFLRVVVENSQAKASWSLGGYLNFLTDEDIAPDLVGDRIFCDVNKAKIIKVPEWIGSYRLSFKPPIWFRELDLQIDGYQEAER